MQLPEGSLPSFVRVQDSRKNARTQLQQLLVLIQSLFEQLDGQQLHRIRGGHFLRNQDARELQECVDVRQGMLAYGTSSHTSDHELYDLASKHRGILQ